MNRVSRAILGGILCAVLAGCGGGGGGMGNGGMPVLGLSSQALLFGAFVSAGANPAPSQINVTNTGGGALNFTASSDSSWLMVTPANGTAPHALQISAALGALAPNTYIGHVTVTANGAMGSPGMITVTFTVGSGVASNAPFWGQWGANPQHTGMVGAPGNNVTNKLADIVSDPFVNQEKAENTPLFGEGVLTVHEQAPIIDGILASPNSDVYMVVKSGTYNSCNPVGAWAGVGAPAANTNCGPNTWNTMVWNEARFSWLNGQLLQVWNFQSDWKPEPNATDPNLGFNGLEGWEPVFHPVDTPNFIYVPGAAGTVWKVNKTTGVGASINPFTGVGGVTAANTFVSSPLTADSIGNIYYNVIELDLTGGGPWDANDVVNAWLVKITPLDATSRVTYAALLPGAPLGTDTTCAGRFFSSTAPLPWPPAVNAVPPTQLCGSQRPAVNVAPVVAAGDGTIYTASRAHFDERVTYLVAVHPDLTVKWAASMQNVLNDGCGVLLQIGPNDTTPNACRVGTNPGVDPTTNAPGSGSLIDQASSSPTVLPDGTIVMGTTTSYNSGRGHLLHFDANGNFINSFDFGWDSTPGVYTHGGTFSVVLKDNHYGGPAYCGANNPVCANTPQVFYITQLDANLNIEWQFQSTTIDANHPNGYEWCINMPAVDMNGNVYVNSEDGNIYKLPQGNSGIFMNPTGKLFLNLALGAAYTPLSIGPDGKLYTQNNGHFFAVGN